MSVNKKYDVAQAISDLSAYLALEDKAITKLRKIIVQFPSILPQEEKPLLDLYESVLEMLHETLSMHVSAFGFEKRVYEMLYQQHYQQQMLTRSQEEIGDE